MWYGYLHSAIVLIGFSVMLKFTLTHRDDTSIRSSRLGHYIGGSAMGQVIRDLVIRGE